MFRRCSSELSPSRADTLVSEAPLAALAIEHGATLGSFDRDFLRFEGSKFELLRA